MESQPDAVSPNSAATPAGSGGSSKPSSRLPELVLVVSGAGAADGEFYIQPNLSIGRGPSNTVVLEKGRIELIHAVVRRDGRGGLMLATMEGADPPQVGGMKQPAIALRSGVEFTLGAATFRVVHASMAAAPARDIQAPPEPPANSGVSPARRPEPIPPAATAQRRGGGTPPANGGGSTQPAAMFSAPELLAVASAQRAANLFVLVAIVAAVAGPVLLAGGPLSGAVLPHDAMAVVSNLLPAAAYAADAIFLILIWRLAKKTRVLWPWVWVVAAMIPLAGLIVLLVLSQKASAILRSNGVAVGLLGAKAGVIRDLRAKAGLGRGRWWPAGLVAKAGPGRARWWCVGLAAVAVFLLAALAVWHLRGSRGAASVAAGIRAVHQKHYNRAMVAFRKGAAAGNAGAMYDVGWLYDNGYGVPQDYARATQWYRKAAAAGNGPAMNNIGVLYENGQGVPQDYAKAMKWYRKAAAAGNRWAMNNIGVLYDNGEGVPLDYAKAMAWFGIAAAAGNARAMSNVGVLYENGDGVPQDYSKALHWFRKAEMQGGPQAAAASKKLIAGIRQAEAGQNGGQ